TMTDRTMSIFHNVDDVPESVRNRIMARAMTYRDLSNLYLDVLNACADSAAELTDGDGRGWMVREIAREVDQISTAVLADSQKPFSNDEFLQAVADLVKFAEDRPLFVKAAVADKR